MSKFKKRITKSIKKPCNDCLVIGNAFGHLEEVLEMFNTVFVYKNTDKNLRVKNLVNITNIDVSYDKRHITAVFIDIDYISYFEHIIPLLTSAAPDLFVEGNEVVPKTETKDLYRQGYRAITQLGWCHHWSRIA